jgi:lysozyme family protein
MATFSPCLAFTLDQEGGYQCAEQDPGNWSSGVCGLGHLIGTNLGISAPTLIAWTHDHDGATTPSLMRSLERTTAAAIYATNYWNAVRGEDLPPGIDLMVFDHAVTSGPGRSARLLQTAIGVVSDGFIGPATLAALRQQRLAPLVRTLAGAQKAAYLAIGNATFTGGWVRRVQKRLAAANALLQV